MDQDEEYTDSRQELLTRFRESLSLPMSQRFFDEDDLIEIFDYAGDLNDDYLRMEALLCAARYYPDSKELQERRGIFYSQYSDEARASFVEDNPYGNSLIIYMLHLRNCPPSAQEAPEVLEKILEGDEPLNDEEVIQFVDLAASLNQYQWLKDHLQQLRDHAQFLNGVLYEVSVLADTNHDHAYSAQLMEELTEIEPFNSFYWILLARQYAEIEDGEKAITAIDYALAINPDSDQALVLKARIIYSMERPATDVITLIRKAIAMNPSLEYTKLLASVLNNEGRGEEARAILETALSEAAPSQELEIIPDLIIYAPENADALLDRYYALSEENTQLMWASWAQQLSLQGYHDLAKRIVVCFERNSGVRIPTLFTIEDSFVAQNFEDTIFALNDYIKDIGASEQDFPSVVAMHVISMIKTGAFVKAYAFCDFFMRNADIDHYKSVGNRLEYLGLIEIIQQIRRKLAVTSDPSDWEDFDPLNFWQDSL